MHAAGQWQATTTVTEGGTADIMALVDCKKKVIQYAI
jgi:hypothetical protein